MFRLSWHVTENYVTYDHITKIYLLKENGLTAKCLWRCLISISFQLCCLCHSLSIGWGGIFNKLYLSKWKYLKAINLRSRVKSHTDINVYKFVTNRKRWWQQQWHQQKCEQIQSAAKWIVGSSEKWVNAIFYLYKFTRLLAKKGRKKHAIRLSIATLLNVPSLNVFFLSAVPVCSNKRKKHTTQMIFTFVFLSSSLLASTCHAISICFRNLLVFIFHSQGVLFSFILRWSIRMLVARDLLYVRSIDRSFVRPFAVVELNQAV